MGARWRALKQELGQTYIDNVEHWKSVAHMCAQDGYRTARNPVPLNYDALEMCLAELAREVKIAAVQMGRPVVVRMPRIGCGLAGGNWELVEMLIRSQLVDQGIEVHVLDLEKS